jgi:hypothetical protein
MRKANVFVPSYRYHKPSGHGVARGKIARKIHWVTARGFAPWN